MSDATAVPTQPLAEGGGVPIALQLARLRESPQAGLIELLRASIRHCRQAVHCETARIWLARRGGRRLVGREYSEGDTPPRVLRFRRGEGLAGYAMARGESLRLEAGAVPAEARGQIAPFRAALIVPLRRGGVVFGAIECLNPLGREAFLPADMDRLEAEREPIEIALDNALLAEESERHSLEREVLFDLTRTLSATLGLDELLDATFRALGQVVKYDAAAIYLVNPRSLALEQVADIGYPAGAEEAFGLRVGVGLVGWVAKTGEAVIVSDVRQDKRYVAARPSTRSELAAPLLVGDRTIGVFNLESDVEDAFHEGHLELLTAFASHAAVALERARLTRELLERRHLEKELAIAREIQLSFLPKGSPVVPGFDLAGAAWPHAEVGGDYYDFIRLPGPRIGLAIADSSGKGIPAALLMAGFRMSLLAEIRNDFAIRAVMRKVNSLLHESTESDKFVTAFYGILDFKSRVLTFTNAGHNPPLLARADGRIQSLVEGGMTLGVLPDATYDEMPVALETGDVVLFYTDGVSEAEAPSGEQFGQVRLEQLLQQVRGRTAREILDAVAGAVLEWAGDRGQTDDLTLMVLKILR